MEDRLCHSLNHRAVLQLFRAAHGLAISPADRADIKNASSKDLVRISARHGIAPLMADGLDGLDDLEVERDLGIFWQEMRDGNRQRNLKMKAQLEAVAAILSGEQVPAVVLKGGCTLVLASPGQFHRRFIGDLDLLVGEADLPRAVSALLASGYRNFYADDAFYHAPGHHDAPLVSDAWPAAVELHTTIGGADGARFLPPGAILETAEAAPVANLRVPSPLNRLVHSVHHGQVQDAGYRDRVLLLKNVADLVPLAEDPQLVREARQVFDAAGLGQSCDGLLAATGLLLPGLLPAQAPDRDAQAWARTAIRRIGTPRRATFDIKARNVGRWIHGFATDPELRSIYGAKLMKPGRFRRMAQTLRNFNRQ